MPKLPCQSHAWKFISTLLVTILSVLPLSKAFAESHLSAPSVSYTGEYTVSYHFQNFPGTYVIYEGPLSSNDEVASGSSMSGSVRLTRPQGTYQYYVKTTYMGHTSTWDPITVTVINNHTLSEALSSFEEFDIYYGDINQDGIAGDIYLHGKNPFVLLHGEVSVPLLLDGREGILYPAMANGSYNAAESLTLSFAEVSKFTKATQGLDFYLVDFDQDGTDEIMIRGSDTARRSLVLHLDSPTSVADTELKKFYKDDTWFDFSDRSQALEFVNVDADSDLEIVFVGDRNNADFAVSYSQFAVTPSHYIAEPRYLPTSLVGASDVQFNVNEQGQATINVPIEVPAGSGGVKPTVGFSYNSAGGNGALMGVGWSMAAFESIALCRKTLAYDGLSNIEPLQYDGSDPLCYKGQRLINSSGNNYVTVLNPEARITKVGDYFTVEARDGSIRYFGLNSTERQTVNGQTVKWAESKTCDSAGNCINYNYNKIGTEKQLLISNIQYAIAGGQPHARIDFTYEKALEATSYYIAGQKHTDARNQRLVSITLKSADSSGGLKEVRRFDVHYLRQVPAERHVSAVDGIQECVGNTCLQPTKFEWSYQKQNTAFANNADYIERAKYNNDGAIHEIVPMDINGDGYQDIVWLEGDWQSAGDGSSDPIIRSRLYNPDTKGFSNEQTLVDKSYGFRDEVNQQDKKMHLRAIDMNADGLMDLAVRRSYDGSVFVKLSYGDQLQANTQAENVDYYSPTNLGTSIINMDVNGDGLSDILSSDYFLPLKAKSDPSGLKSHHYHDADRVASVWNFTPRPFDAVPESTDSQYTIEPKSHWFGVSIQPSGDFDGDGLQDVVYTVRRRQDAELFDLNPEIPSVTKCWLSEDHIYLMRNNGDGSFDEYAFLGEDTYQNILSLDGVGGDYCWASDQPPMSTVIVDDFNRDGFADVIFRRNNAYYLHENKGDGTFDGFSGANGELGSTGQGGKKVLSFALDHQARTSGLQLIDVTLDGSPDLVWTVEHQRNYGVRKVINYLPFDPKANQFTTDWQDLQAPEMLEDDTFVLADIDADGSVDLIRQTGADIHLHLNQSASRPAEITEFTNGLGAKTRIEYEWSAVSSHYTSPIERFRGEGSRSGSLGSYYDSLRDPHAGLPDVIARQAQQIPVINAGRIVTRIDSAAPAYDHGSYLRDMGEIFNPVNLANYDPANESAIEYFYGDAYTQPGAFGNLGFRQVTSQDMQSLVKVSSFYRQDWPYIGAPYRTESRLFSEIMALKISEHTILNVPNISALRADENIVSNVGSIRSALESTWDISFPMDASVDYLPPVQISVFGGIVNPNECVSQGVAFCDDNTAASAVTYVNSEYDSNGYPTVITTSNYGGGSLNSQSKAAFLSLLPLKKEVITNRYEMVSIPSDIDIHPEGNGLITLADGLGGYRSDGITRLKRITHARKEVTRNRFSTVKTNSQDTYFTYYASGPYAGLLKEEAFIPQDASKRVYKQHFYDSFGNETYTQTRSTNQASQSTFYDVINQITYSDEQLRRSDRIEYDSTGRFPIKTYSYFEALAAERLTSQVLSFAANGSPITTRNVLTGLENDFEYDVLGRQVYAADNIGNAQGTAVGNWTTTEYLACSASLNCPATTAFVIKTNSASGAKSYTYMDILAREIRAKTLAFDATRYLQVDTYFDGKGNGVLKSEPYYTGDAPLWNLNVYSFDNKPVYTRSADGAEGFVAHLNNQKIYTNHKGQERKEIFDDFGRLLAVYDHNGSHVNNMYDLDGNLYLVRKYASGGDAFNLPEVETRFEYDSIGNKIAMEDSDLGRWEYYYNGFGELVWQRDARGTITSFVYDTHGRVKETMKQGWESDNLGDIERTVVYFDGLTDDPASVVLDRALGQVSATIVTSRSSGTTCSSTSAYSCTYATYDSFGRPIESATALFDPNKELGEERSLGVYGSRTEYDALGRAYKHYDALDGLVKDAAGNTITSGTQTHFNSAGYAYKTTNLADGALIEQTSGMSVHGKTTVRLLGNGVRTDFGYSKATGLLELQTSSVGAITNAQKWQYTWDKLGNLTSRKNDSLSANGATLAIRETFCYDDLNRLTDSYLFDGAMPSSGCIPGANIREHQSMVFDDYGSLRAKKLIKNGSVTGESIVDYQYGQLGYSSYAGAHAVTQTRTQSGQTVRYAYDGNGNRITDETGRTFSYTLDNKVHVITKGGHKTRFEYSGGSRYLRRDTKDSTRTTTLYLGSVERVQTGNQVRWKRAVGSAAVFEVATDTLNTLAANDAYTRTFILKDHLGSTDVITDGSGALISNQSFDAWGQRRSANDAEHFTTAELVALANSQSGPMSVHRQVNPHTTTKGFTGHEMLDEMGIIHMNGRIYDQAIGLFAQADPMLQAPTNVQNYNRYSYVVNNPLSATDPSGYNFEYEFRRVAGLIIAAVITWACVGQCAPAAAAFYLAIGAAVGTIIAGGDAGDAGVAAVTSMLTFGSGNIIVNAVVQGVIGGITAKLQGENFGRGFAAAGAASLLGAGGKSLGLPSVITSAVASGTASEITGGKFKNGAARGAFGALLMEGAGALGGKSDAGGGNGFDPNDPYSYALASDGDNMSAEERAALAEATDEALDGDVEGQGIIGKALVILGRYISPSKGMNLTAGFGDGIYNAITFGIGDDLSDIRWLLGLDVAAIDTSASSYNAAFLTGGIAGGAALGGAIGVMGKGVKGYEYSHFVPQRFLSRFGITRSWKSPLNGTYVPKWYHALTDVFRFRFMPKTWKQSLPFTIPQGAQQVLRTPPVYIGAGAGATSDSGQ